MRRARDSGADAGFRVDSTYFAWPRSHQWPLAESPRQQFEGIDFGTLREWTPQACLGTTKRWEGTDDCVFASKPIPTR